MKRMVFAFAIVGCLLVGAQAGLWSGKGLEEQTVGKPDASRKLLIIGTTSDFKQAVVDKVVREMRNDSLYIQVMSLKKIKKVNPDDWTAILFVNTCIAWNYDKRIRKFVAKYPDYGHYVLFTSSGDKDKCTDKKRLAVDVDAVSSASHQEYLKSAAGRVIGMVRKHFLRWRAPQE